MSSLIRIKRSSVSGNPTTLAAGELAYTSLTDNGSNGGDRLYIGMGTETAGNAANHFVIGGKYFTDLMDHTPGTLTATSAILVDANKKIDDLLIDNLELNGNTLSTTDTNGNLILAPNGTGLVSIASAYTLPRIDGISGYVLTTNGAGVVSWAASAASLNIAGDTGTDGVSLLTDTLTFVGGDGITSAITNNTVTFDADATIARRTDTTYVGTTAVALNRTSANLALTGILSTAYAGATSGTITLTPTAVAGTNTITLPAATGTVALTNNNLGVFAATTSAQLAGVISDETGSGSLVFAVSPTISSPVIDNVVASGATATADLYSEVTTGSITVGAGLTTGTLNIAAAGTGATAINIGHTNSTITLVGSIDIPINSAVVLGTNASGVIAAATTTGTGSTVVLSTSPTLVTPVLGVATATSINKVTITAPATAATLTIADGKTITVSNTLTFTGTDGSSVAFGTGGTVAYTANKLSVFAATTSAELAGVISDETGTGSLVFATSPTLVTPNIGAATATSITGTGALSITAGGTNTNVTLVPNGTGTVDVSGKKITSVADPTQAQDAATKAYVDANANGLDVKASARLSTTANLTVTYNNGASGVGATLTNAGTQAALNLDSVPAVVGDRVLVKDQTAQLQNGIYVVTDVGSASTNWILTRAGDFDNSPGLEVGPGVFCFVEEGTLNQDNGYVVTTNGAITIGTTAIVWNQFSGAGQITAGAGLTKTGNTIDVGAGNGITVNADNVALATTVAGAGLTYTTGVLDVVGTANRITVNADSIDIASTYVGQTSITTLGTIGSGTWQGTIVSPTYGGTGVNNGAKTITLGGNLTTSGAFASTFTMTNTTSVTFPTTGTLATLAGAEALSNKTITLSSFSGTTIAGSGLITFTNTTDAGPLGTAAVVLSGGLSVAKQIYVGTNITGSGPTNSSLDGFTIDGGTY